MRVASMAYAGLEGRPALKAQCRSADRVAPAASALTSRIEEDEPSGLGSAARSHTSRAAILGPQIILEREADYGFTQPTQAWRRSNGR